MSGGSWRGIRHPWARLRLSSSSWPRDCGRGPDRDLHHGGGFRLESWDLAGWVEPQATGYQVVTFDARGNGYSDKPTDPRDYALDLMVGDVLAVADACGPEVFHYLGFSLGAKVGWGVAAWARIAWRRSRTVPSRSQRRDLGRVHRAVRARNGRGRIGDVADVEDAGVGGGAATPKRLRGTAGLLPVEVARSVSHTRRAARADAAHLWHCRRSPRRDGPGCARRQPRDVRRSRCITPSSLEGRPCTMSGWLGIMRPRPIARSTRKASDGTPGGRPELRAAPPSQASVGRAPWPAEGSDSSRHHAVSTTHAGPCAPSGRPRSPPRNGTPPAARHLRRTAAGHPRRNGLPRTGSGS